MKLWPFYLAGILATALFEMCLLRIYDLASWPAKEDEPDLPTGRLQSLPMKAFAYVKSNTTLKIKKKRPMNKFKSKNAAMLAGEKRPNRTSLGGNGDGYRKITVGEVRRNRPNRTSLEGHGYPRRAVGDGLSLGPPKKAGERRIRAEELKVPTPIIVLSLPKSGTSSLFQYFTCGGVYAAHTFGLDRMTKNSYRIGARFRKNLRNGLPMLTNTEPLNVFSDIGYVHGDNDCFYPSVEALDSIARDYPHATLIVSYRPGWYKSIWNFRMMGKRWKKWCPIFPNTTDEIAWEAFYVQHRERIRELVQKHPTLHHLEFDLTDPTAGQQLEDFTGISRQCWGDCKPNMKCSFKSPANMTAEAN